MPCADADGDELIVVVEIDAVRAQFREALDRIARVERGADELAERIATAVADGPEAEGELVRGTGLQVHRTP